MSMNKHFGMLALSVALAAGCSGPDSNTDPTSSEQQAIGGYYQSNGYTPNYTDSSITYFNPQYGWVSKVPIRGISVVNGWAIVGRTATRTQSWYVMDDTNDRAAVIDSMSYCGSPVSNHNWNTVTSSGGYFNVSLYQNGVTQSPIQVYNDNSIFNFCHGPLTMHVGAPYNGTIQITPTTKTTAAQIYTAVFISDSAPSSPQFMDPVTTIMFDGSSSVSNGYLVPVPGITWNLHDGTATQVSTAITFANSNDTVGACIGFGYDPANPTMLEACARMKRADFCGNGFAWTDSAHPAGAGASVMLWDNGGAVHANPGMPINLTEALWGPNGAVCVNQNALRLGTGFDLCHGAANGLSCANPLQIFDAATSCPQPLPPCTTFSTTWNMASSAWCTQWDAAGTTCLAIPKNTIQ